MDPYVSFKKSNGLIGFLCSIINVWRPREIISNGDLTIHFASEALSSSTLCKVYLLFKGLTFLVMWRTWHLEGLNCISHIFSHCSRHAMSVCRVWPSVVELIARYMSVSSAKSLTLDLTCSGRSLMYAIKRIGPRTEPCGTPEETGTSSELIPLITIVCFRLSKKSLIHYRVSPLMP